MKNKINIHNFWRSDAFIIMMFAVMSVMSVVVMWHSGFVSSEADLTFHLQRIYEINNDILHGTILPNVSLNTFNQTGSAVISLYPNLNVYPMALLSLFIKSFTTFFYVIWILRNLFALIVSYYSCKSYVNNKKISFIFSIIYTLSTVSLYFQSSKILGMSTATIFLPLVLFGFLNLLEKNKWIELTIGMSAIILCHILSILITTLFLIFMVLINIKKILSKDTLKSFMKFAIVTLLMTSGFIVHFFVLMISNKIGTPPLPPRTQIESQPIKILFSYFILHPRPSVSITGFIGLILSIIKYKSLSKYSKQFFWLSVLFILMCSKLFPWQIFRHTVVETTIQFTWRFYIIPEILLSYLFAILIINIFKNDMKKQLSVFSILFIVVSFVYIMGQAMIIKSQHYNEIKKSYDVNSDYIIENNSELNYVLEGYIKNQYDYYPQSAIKSYNTINQHLATYDGNKHIKMKLLGNGGYEFSNKAHIKDLSLPFLYYNGINYQIKLDGKTVSGFANKNSLMTIKNINKGRHHVRIIVHNTKMQIVSYITSLIGLIILLGAIIKKYIKRR